MTSTTLAIIEKAGNGVGDSIEGYNVKVREAMTDLGITTSQQRRIFLRAAQEARLDAIFKFTHSQTRESFEASTREETDAQADWAITS